MWTMWSTWQRQRLAPAQLSDVIEGPVHVRQAEGRRLRFCRPRQASIAHGDLPHAVHRHCGIHRRLCAHTLSILRAALQHCSGDGNGICDMQVQS